MNSLWTCYEVHYEFLTNILQSFLLGPYGHIMQFITRTLCTYYAVNYEVLMDILLSDFYVPYGHITRFLTEGGTWGMGGWASHSPPPLRPVAGCGVSSTACLAKRHVFFGTSVNMQQQQRSRSQVELLQQVLGLVLELHLQLFRKQQRR